MKVAMRRTRERPSVIVLMAFFCVEKIDEQ